MERQSSLPIHALAFHPNGQLLFSGSGPKLIVHSLQHRTVVRIDQPFGHSETIHRLKFTPDGKWLVATGGRCCAVINVLVPLSVQQNELETVELSVKRIGLAQDWLFDGLLLDPQTLLAVTAHGVIYLYLREESGGFTLRKRFRSAHIQCILYSASLHLPVEEYASTPFRPLCDRLRSVQLAVGTVWNAVMISAPFREMKSPLESVSDDQVVTDAQFSDLRGHEGVVFRVHWSADGRMLASASDDRSLRVYRRGGDEKWGCCATLWGHSARVFSCCFIENSEKGIERYSSPSYLVSASEDSISRLWDLSSCVCVGELHGHKNANVWDVAVTNAWGKGHGKEVLMLDIWPMILRTPICCIFLVRLNSVRR